MAKPVRPRRAGVPTMIQRSRAIAPSDKVAFAMEGAGKSGVRREFFGLTDSDEEAIADRVEAAIEQALDMR